MNDPKVGRPPLDRDSPSTMVTVRVPARQYDKLYADAQRDRVTVSDLIRRRLHGEPERREP